MATAAIYLRVSTDEQGESGNGLRAQEDACRAYAARMGLDVAGVFVDAGVSGVASLEVRPGLLDAMGAIERGGVLLVAKRDRLARDPLVGAMVERLVGRKGARIVSAAGEGTENDDPTSVLMRRIVDAFAEYERLVIGARTKSALKARRTRGLKTGGDAPYGFAVVNGTLVAVEAEQAVIQEARTLRAAGLSLRAVASELQRRGFATRKGGSFDATQVRRMVA